MHARLGRCGRAIALAGLLALGLPVARAGAHASEQSLVMLLPTDVYIASGVLVVGLTVVLTALLPARLGPRLFAVSVLPLRPARILPLVSSSCCLVVTLALIAAGFAGARDPLANPLTLSVWTLFWIAVLAIQGLIGDVWRWLNPWTGPYALLRAFLGNRPPFRMPPGGGWIAVLGLVSFGYFLLADPAPADPARLAVVVALYWLTVFAGLLLFGHRFLYRADFITLLLGLYAQIALVGRRNGRVAVGVPAWRLSRQSVPSWPAAVFAVLLLASGSFDGLNETFWWLALLDINPLEFPGRSAIVKQTTVGLVVAGALLVSLFACAVWLGLRLAGATDRFGDAFRLSALALLPIALGYHVGHYLPSFLVDGQYALVAASDPLATGADYLGLGRFYVTTGFFNTRETVRAIWLSQAGAVVAGHVLSILVAHAFAVRLLGEGRPARLSQYPLSAFMIAYTLFGLWLLAAPRGA